ncbi:MAG TPA: hypothetical protein VG013_14120 [Gemmataceae bacterium]|nr:hypothetical protein [Gemmataceae bacterium]
MPGTGTREIVRLIFGLAAGAASFRGLPVQAGELDLRKAVVVVPPGLSKSEGKALDMLVDEVRKRTLIRWPVARTWPADSVPVVAVGPAASLKAFAGPFTPQLAGQPAKGAEGYRICTQKGDRATSAVFVIGNDARGVLFGVGRLLRALHMTRGKVVLDDGFTVATAPRYRLRGHQLGYRPKTNSYDGWDLALWEQYIRDLAVFGTNAVELIPPRSDDAADSPHFPLPPMDMMVGMSKLLDDYGLDVWLWYPAMDRDYADPATVDFALKEWGEVFRKLPRVDAVFVPGGDPGHTQPKYLLALLEKQTRLLHRHHPRAQMWVSPQSFSQEWLDEFCDLLRKEQPDWLSGVVYGPQVRVSLPQLRALIPRKYPIRRYPDITHSRQCQYPVPDWDLAYALTEARECINPRPRGEARIFRIYQAEAVGFLAYSEGCNDDVNKIVWSSLGWNPDADVLDILREYSGYFIGERYRDGFAQGLLALERNWKGPLLTNASVYTTLQQFRSMEKAASPKDLLNWRFQQALYRAYYDAYERSRLIYETGLEDRAMDQLRQAERLGPVLAMNRAEAILDRAVTEPVAGDWRARVHELAEALFQSIRMQLSVPRYKAIDVDRGANLDTIDVPLNNRGWLKGQFAELRRSGNDAERRQGLERIIHWTDPGPGGFYDDLGSLAQQPHLVRGPGFKRDPAFRRSALIGFTDDRPSWRRCWCRHAEALYDAPLQVRYKGLDRRGQYRVRVVYAGDSFRPRLRLLANEKVELHPWLRKPYPVRPVEFDIPPAATAKGELTLTWYQEAGRGGNGRGCQVSEVWLIKKSQAP